MDVEEFRRAGHELVDWVADFRAGLAGLPVMAAVRPGDVRARLPVSPPAEPEAFASVLADLDAFVVPGLSHFQHPRFFGYFPSNAMLASVLGDYLSTGLGALGLSWQAAPALTEVEETMIDWLRQMLGLAPSWRGALQDTASTATLLALLCARERSTNFSLASRGLQGQAKALVVYVSRYAHSSVEKAALLAGFGRDNVRAVDVDAEFALDPQALASALDTDVAAGRVPCAVVVTSGTTTTTAFDPVGTAVDLAARHGAWVHVDAAMAGNAMILPECRSLWAGVDGADSLVVNPHKWLGAAFDCSAFFVRDAQHLIRVMGTNPSYLQTAADNDVTNYRDWGIALGRRFRALKLWTLVRLEGLHGLQERLRRDLANARWLAAQVAGAADWQVLAPVHLQTVCVRHAPAGLAGEALDRHTLAWVDRINRSGEAYLTPAQLEGRWMCRVSVGAAATERDDVVALWQAMRAAASA
ncbi:MAG: pyridoxal-dependent decarboxylase [Planctomycetota bacterium]